MEIEKTDTLESPNPIEEAKNLLLKEAQDRAAKCSQDIQAVLKAYNCTISTYPDVKINNAPVTIKITPNQ